MPGGVPDTVSRRGVTALDAADGAPWNRSAVLVDLASGTETKLADPAAALPYRPGTRRGCALLCR